MNRHQERDLGFALLFEHEFDKERSVNELYDTAKETREVAESEYVRTLLTGVLQEEASLEAMIAEHAQGWSLGRISKVSLAILKLSAYEMLYLPAIPLRVSLNEAVELVKTYDDEKARAFVNGVLNAIAHKASAMRGNEPLTGPAADEAHED